MIANHFRFWAIFAAMAFVCGCSNSSTVRILVPENIGLGLFEERYLSGGTAPDLLKVYLVESGKSQVGAHDQPIFEGQDVGAVCYQWPSADELEIRISGGYVDHVEAVWRGNNNRAVNIRYMGMDGCVWHPNLGRAN
jgi:hypothetical protein